MKDEYVVNVKTKDGDVLVFFYDKADGLLKKKIVVTQEAYDDLLRAVGKSEAFDPSKDGLNKPPQIQVTAADIVDSIDS